MIVYIAILFVAVLLAAFWLLHIPELNIPANITLNEKLIKLDTWFNNLHKNKKFNGVVLISKQGKVIFSGAYGYNGPDKIALLNEHSSFNLASVSKQFTATGIILLKKRALLNYDDNVSKYIPELSFYNRVTIRHLLHHTSGLPDYMKLTYKYSSQNDILTTKKMIALYQENQPELSFTPGTKFQYSNTGYVLLAEIIERISGTSFESFMKDNIFKPLHMNDTQIFNLLSDNAPQNRVYGFGYRFGLFGGKTQPMDLNNFDGVTGDGAVYSSAHDLNIWHQSLMNGALLDKNVYSDACKTGLLANGSATKYGFGWFINDDGSVEHAGGWQGFTSYLYRNPVKDELIVILDNSSNTLRVNSIGYRFNSIGMNLKKFIADI